MKFSKLICSASLPILLAAGSAHGQTGFPTSSTDFERANSGGFSGVGTESKPKRVEKRTETYTVVSPLRDWKNTKGVVVPGRLLAFEQGNHTDSQKQVTLIKKGKVRLLIEKTKQLHELPLVSLSKLDQEYIQELVRTRSQAAKAKENANAPAKK